MAEKFFLLTLGCFRNEVESDLMRSELLSNNLLETHRIDEADILIVNTCGFLREAVDEGIDTILELHRLSKNLPILLVGCMAERYGNDLLDSMPEVAGVLGVNWQGKLGDAVRTLIDGNRYCEKPLAWSIEIPRVIDSSNNATLLVKVADGCDKRCSFCTIPMIKGPYRSRQIGDILAEIKSLSGKRQREVILLAQDLSSYGIDLYGRTRLAGLIREISLIESVRWIRLLYLQPEGLDEDIINECVSNPKVCDYFDIPFQHASASVLKRMGRGGDFEKNLNIVKRIRSVRPKAALRTTLMVGFPGETDEDFQTLLEFVSEAKFDWLGLFKFSAEEGTIAARLPNQIEPEKADERCEELLALQSEIESERAEGVVGRRLECVIDSPSD
ncbi:MAG: 30S ribosomal protein S12 methylthiotransferase RimO, partial [Actinomycetota bacterium]|nr:30S ribosomal protein S12 methylthiotransferase RimO [Actinomycetota bacterium]